MNCPNCNYELDDQGKTCSHCGVDFVLFNKTIYISDSLYNQGLVLASKYDLTGAIGSLTKSIEFNKNNIHARNLLGLIYFQLGRIGEALKHWLISQKLQPEDNLAIEYVKKAEEDGRALETFNDAVKMYNQALSYVQQKSDDMAIIQLKKALELNPKFVEAMNLLTFCYFIQKDREHAIPMVDKVLSLDINNPIANNYYKELYSERPPTIAIKKAMKTKEPEARTKEREPGKSLYPYAQGNKKELSNSSPFWGALSFIVGAICIAVVFYILILPSALEAKEKEIIQLKSDNSQVESSMKENNDKLIIQLDELTEKYETAISENDSLSEQMTKLERNQRLINIGKLIDEGNNVEAASMLNGFDSSGLAADVIEQVENYKNKIYPNVCQKLYNEGTLAYRNKNYDEAATALGKALIYSEKAQNLADDVLYYLGLTAEAQEDKTKAQSYYETLMEKHPSSNVFSRARQQLQSLTNE